MHPRGASHMQRSNARIKSRRDARLTRPKVERRQIEFCIKAIVGWVRERASAGRKKHFLPLRTKEVDGIARGSVSYTERARSTLFAQAPYYYLLSSKPLDSKSIHSLWFFCVFGRLLRIHRGCDAATAESRRAGAVTSATGSRATGGAGSFRQITLAASMGTRWCTVKSCRPTPPKLSLLFASRVIK